jgi:hypothetical protein
MAKALNMTIAFSSGVSEVTHACGEYRVKRE